MLRSAVLALAAVSISSPVLAAPSRPLSPAEKSMVEHAVRAQLLDPDGARFRHNAFRTGEDQYCGLVNAKNRMGGFTGYRVFSVDVVKSGGRIKHVTGATLVTSDDPGGDGDALGMITTSGCAAAGYKVDY